MSNILLTGSSGFIGSNILKNLSKNHQIYIVVRKPLNKKKKLDKNIRIIKFNNYEILNLKLKKIKIDTVVHCATHYVKEHTFQDINKLINSNILLGNIILENCKKMNVKNFINFSSVWENNDKINVFVNLYAAYKKGFSYILGYYKKILPKIKFYELMLADTFGENDNRPKIINTLKNNYKKNKLTKIISKNLYLNLLNIEDIIKAIEIILSKKIKAGQYILKNKKNIKIYDLITLFNKKNKKKIEIKWYSNKLIKNKIYPYKKFINWKHEKSNINDIINIIKK